MIETIQWTPEGVVMIDQTRIPAEETYVTCKTYEQVADVKLLFVLHRVFALLLVRLRRMLLSTVFLFALWKSFS